MRLNILSINGFQFLAKPCQRLPVPAIMSFWADWNPNFCGISLSCNRVFISSPPDDWGFSF